MEEMAERYWECPKCGFVLTFHLKGDKYVSFCPFCKDSLEIDKAEYEDDSNDSEEVYFEKDF